MDRYEYNVKSDQIKKLYGKKDYATAAEIADSIDWGRVKNNAMLAMVADAYEATKQYEKARDILEIAYERSPMGRQLAYRLTIISIRMRDFVSADEYYQDFIRLSPRDVAQYILKYRIARARGEDISVLINILEAYVDVEMDERWQYELAKLYHEAGEEDKCVSMCDKIILWFSEGKYVTKAMELKMKHRPLTEEQQAKYDGKWDYYNERIKSDEQEEEKIENEEQPEQENADEEEAAAEVNEEQSSKENIKEETDSSAEILMEEDTVRDILNDTTALDYLTDYSEDEKLIKEPEETEVDEETAIEVEQQLARIVEESVESAKKEMDSDEAVEDESVEDEPEDEEEQTEEDDSLFGDIRENIEGMDDTELVAKAYTSEVEEDDMEEDEEMESEMELDSEEILQESADSEEIRVMPDTPYDKPDSKIEIFEFDESKSGKVKNIGDELMKTAEIDIDEINLQVQPAGGAIYDTANIQEALAKSMKIILQAESEKATRNAFSESEVMDEPTKRIEKEESKDTVNQEEPEVREVKKKPVYETVPLQPIYDKEEDGQIALFQPEKHDEQVDGQMDMEDVLLEMEKSKREALEEAARKEEEAREVAMRAAQEAAAARAAVEKALAEEAAARAALERASKTQETLAAESILPENMDSEFDSSDIPEQETNSAINGSVSDISDRDMDNEEAKQSEDTDEIPDEADSDETAQESSGEQPLEEINSESSGLSDEYKKMFVDFLDVMGLEEQIAATLDSLINNFVKDGTSKSNNVIIMGDAKSGKTTLALSIIKAANKGRGRTKRKVAKVKASALNKKGISAVMSQILGTDLIIEQAGNLMPGTVVDLIAAMKTYTEEMIIVLEDDKAALERLVTAHPALEDIFNNQISIKEFSIDDFVRVGKEYARSKNYVIDEMGTLALYAKIDDYSGKNQGISRTEIYEIIDEAISHAERFKISRLIGKLKRTHYEMGVLKEEDF